MKAKHVMVSPVITGTRGMSVRDVAKVLSDNRISALPIADEAGNIVGIVSEGDLIHRAEIGTQKQRSWWLSLLTSNVQLAEEYARSHAKKVDDVMTHEVVSVDPETPLSDVAQLFEKRRIKRVPVLKDGRLVGIVTRANLVQAIATAPQKEHRPLADEEIREKLQKRLEAQPWANVTMLNVTVSDGVVHLWGIVRSEAERNAIRVAVESIPGVRAVKDNLALESLPAWV